MSRLNPLERHRKCALYNLYRSQQAAGFNSSLIVEVVIIVVILAVVSTFRLGHQNDQKHRDRHT